MKKIIIEIICFPFFIIFFLGILIVGIGLIAIEAITGEHKFKRINIER